METVYSYVLHFHYFHALTNTEPTRKMQSGHVRCVIPKALYELLVDHVFLPKRITGIHPKEIDQQENLLLSFIWDSMIHSHIELRDSTNHLFETMVNIHCHGGMEKTRISDHIKSISPGQMIGLFIRQQNCGLLIYRQPQNREIIVSTFQASVPNEIICSSPSDVQVSFLIPFFFTDFVVYMN